MRLLHTSDWHLGRSLHGLDLIEHQEAALGHVVAVARAEQVDAVLVCGDVYDRAVPPVPAVGVFERVVGELASFTHVIISSGNHDSGIRLGALAEHLVDRIHIRTRLDRLDEPVVLVDRDGPVLVYALPYLDPESARYVLGGEDGPVPRSHEAVLGAAMDRVRADLAVRRAGQDQLLRTVVMAHAFVAGRERPAQTSDSERDLRVGGVDVVPTDVFAGIDYTALGHLHGPQEPRSADGLVRYSGSPLRYSFSEAGQTKGVTLVDLDATGNPRVRTVDVPQPRPMAELRGTLAELVGDASLTAHEGAWVRALVTDEVRPDRMHDALRARFPHLLSAHHVPSGSGTITLDAAAAAADPLDVLARFLRDASGVDDESALAEHLALVREHYEAQCREDGVA
ncbi:MAG: exonuclease SbcCD subunit D [Candidatus Nanopelagicales bacterium]|jgi:exonuclease SbcD|nr:exonuclease SbcCD subunit D [Candidatus Nanopelagicales bacterium]